ncbi:secretion protein HlyD [Rhodoferax koreense]|uniref:Membrane fusion protein (MFP) family protein n=1 Tax=Rhodoferax koreensis TaxID=1842727 RepID=A0A1P8JU86_9BURK|nr:HlyD family type I secretion periplasmic adaptor subunit [Rhodoferax koreense]APW37324.1 secretion protein HlyD [Rhodoferax koreense]
MEPANKPPVKKKAWWPWRGKDGAPGRTIVEYLPDADEIERSPVPRFAQVTLHVMVLGFVAFIVWASVSKVDQVIIAQGRLVNPLPNVVVQPLETSVIQSVDVRIGQIVKKGERLASLDATFVQADETQLRQRLNSLETQIGGLEQELAGGADTRKAAADGDSDGRLQASIVNERKANYRAQQLKLSENVARLRAALATNRQDQQFVASRLKSLKDIEAMQERMVAQKFGAPLQLLEAQQRTKEVQRDLELVVSREQELRRELGAYEAEKSAFEKGWRQKTMEDLLSISRERDSIKEQLQKADRRQKLVTLAAPVDAVVLDIAKLSPGSVVREAETFFTLVPLNVVLEAEVQIESADVGYIKTGDPVHVKLDAYPFQRHGTLDAQVRTISQDAFRRETAAKSGADAFYVSRIALQPTPLKNMKEGARLLPGMTLAAEIVVGQRSVMSYLAWPLTKGMNEAIREP